MSSPFDADFRVGLYPESVLRFDQVNLYKLLTWCYESGISDITLRSGEPVFARSQGRLIRITQRDLSSQELGGLMNEVYGANATSVLGGAVAIDTAIEVKVNRETKIRFRINISNIYSNGGTGYEISLRTIRSMPVLLESLGIEQVIIDNFFPAMGMVAVTGETGSGKSTLLSAMIRWKIAQENQSLKILTGEAPIEYVYDDCSKPDCIVSQSEIPRDFRNFADFIRSAMRRDPNGILVGESRDAETVAAAIEASTTGHFLHTTLHSNGAPSTIGRLVNFFPESERSGRMIDVIENMKLVVTQRLLKTIDGKRTAIREYLVFDEEVREILLRTKYENIPAKVRELTIERGRTMEMHAKEKFDQGIISNEEYMLIARKSGV